jgi:hypothetical protein
MQGLKQLRVIQELNQNKPDWENRDIFRILQKEDIWIAAYENIKGTKGVDETSLVKLQELQRKVLVESYRFQPVFKT